MTSATTGLTEPTPHSTRAMRPGLARVFLGVQGIRSGWSALIFLSIYGAVMFLTSLAIPKGAAPKGDIPPGLTILFEIFKLAVVLGATAIMARIEGRSLWSYGLTDRRSPRNFLFGWLGGLACLSLLAGALCAAGYLAFDGLALHGLPIIGYGLIWFLAFMLVGLAEETLNRGYLLATLARGVGFWPAALLSSLWFAGSHVTNHGETAAGVAGVLLAGLVFCLLLRVSGSLWLGVGFHAAWDWAQSFLYGVPDSGSMMEGHLFVTHAMGDPRVSGGSAGPEGSLLGAPVLILGPLALVWLLRRAGILSAKP